jgi:hypothetical protein
MQTRGLPTAREGQYRRDVAVVGDSTRLSVRCARGDESTARATVEVPAPRNDVVPSGAPQVSWCGHERRSHSQW